MKSTFHILVGVLFLVITMHTSAQVYAVFRNHFEPDYDARNFKSEDISPDLPGCKRNDAIWWNQVQGYEKNLRDPRFNSDGLLMRGLRSGPGPQFEDWPMEFRKPKNKAADGTPIFGPDQGVTWIDIDGDGWCDVIVSVQPEAKKRQGLPIILGNASAALFFDPATKSFKPGTRGFYFTNNRRGEITSVFTFYYNMKVHRVETVERQLTGGLFYSSEGWKERHGQLTFKGEHQTKPLCDAAGGESEACIAHTGFQTESEGAFDDLNISDPVEDAIRNRLLTYRDELFQAAH